MCKSNAFLGNQDLKVDMPFTIIYDDEKVYKCTENGIGEHKETRYLLNSVFHREDGPAHTHKNYEAWYWEGKRHRLDGPAVTIITSNGIKEEQWWINGDLHRENGPAQQWSDGWKSYYKHGKFHREDGPALERPDGHKEWWINGINLPVSCQEEFERLLKLKSFW